MTQAEQRDAGRREDSARRKGLSRWGAEIREKVEREGPRAALLLPPVAVAAAALALPGDLPSGAVPGLLGACLLTLVFNLWAISPFTAARRTAAPGLFRRHRLSAGALLDGALWGVGAALIVPAAAAGTGALVLPLVAAVLTLAGIAGYTAAQNASLPAALGFVWLALSPLALRVLAAGSRIETMLAAVLLIYAATASFSAVRHHRRRLVAAELWRENTALHARLRQTDEQLAHALRHADLEQEAKRVFLGRMSHELRTPLNAVIGFSDLLRNEIHGPIGDPAYRAYAADINQSGSDLLALVGDLLDLSKIEAGRFELEESRVSLVETLDSVLRQMQPAAAQKQLSLQSRLPAALPDLMADHHAVRQMLHNLVSNAVKFTPGGGRVEITAEHIEEGLSLSVTDSGIGIAPEELDRAMAPFGQVLAAQEAGQRGTGLGLPLVQNLIELHGGRFVLRSLPGSGTTATLYFPPDRLCPPTEGA